MTDIMVDIETLDTRPSAVILSIGACRIDWETNKTDDYFYVVIDKDSCIQAGLSTSPSTEKWWASQSEEARAIFTDPNRVDLLEGLKRFSEYMLKFRTTQIRSNAKLWGNGSDFDNTIIANAYAQLGLDPPWHFYNNRCFRTAKDLFSDVMPKLQRQGTHHNALDDAVYQANGLLQLKNSLRHKQVR